MREENRVAAKVYKATQEQLVRALCAKDEPCLAHRETIDRIIRNLEKAKEVANPQRVTIHTSEG